MQGVTEAYKQIPEENRAVTCPYCHKAQNPLNIPLRLTSSKEWICYDCEHCGQVFGYMQFVERIYISVGVKEELENDGPKNT